MSESEFAEFAEFAGLQDEQDSENSDSDNLSGKIEKYIVRYLSVGRFRLFRINSLLFFILKNTIRKMLKGGYEIYKIRSNQIYPVLEEGAIHWTLELFYCTYHHLDVLSVNENKDSFSDRNHCIFEQ